jgi:hypothetical protein
MHIGAVLRRWIEVLATLYLAWRDSRRELRSLVVTHENQHFVVRRAEPARDLLLRDAKAGSVLATVPFGTSVSPELARSVRDGFVIFELPAGKVVMRRVTVPGSSLFMGASVDRVDSKRGRRRCSSLQGIAATDAGRRNGLFDSIGSSGGTGVAVKNDVYIERDPD